MDFGKNIPHGSTYDWLIDMIDKVSSALNNKELTCGIFIDLSKAFDTLDHHFSLENCIDMGFTI